MSNQQVIKLSDVVKRVPSVLAKLPRAFNAAKILNPMNENISIGWAVENTTRKYPNNVAIYYEDRALTYSEFNRRINQVSHYLLSIGVKKGDVVALSMQNRPEFLICAMGIAKIGGVAALINTSQTSKVLSYSINLVNPVAAIVGEEQLESFNQVRADLDLPWEQALFVGDWDVFTEPKEAPESYINLAEEALKCSGENPEETKQVSKSDHLFYIYTSGTTGMPKASITNHERALGAYAGLSIVASMKPDDIFYATLPLYHATGLLVCWIGGVLSSGGALVTRKKFSTSRFWEDIHHYQCTAFGYVGELCRYLLNAPEHPDDANNSVRTIIGNGLRPSIWKEFRKRFAIDTILEFYASSEGNVAFFNLFNLDETVGFGAGNVALVKYDKEKEETVKDANGFMIKADVGEAGLMLGKITKATPFIGYTQKDKTEKALFHNVFKEGDSYFNTGDLLRNVGCKHYQFVDRLGDTFRWKGENVSTTELENIFAEIKGISDSVVYGVEVPNTDGKAGMVSLTPIDPEQPVDLHKFLAHAVEELPPYAVPLFVRIKNEMDTTGTFKYKKSDLKKDGFNPESTAEPLHVLLPRTKEYVPLTSELYRDIHEGKYSF